MPSEKEIKAAVDAVAREDERAHDREYVASVLERGGWEEHVARTALSAAEREREGETLPVVFERDGGSLTARVTLEDPFASGGTWNASDGTHGLIVRAGDADGLRQVAASLLVALNDLQEQGSGS